MSTRRAAFAAGLSFATVVAGCASPAPTPPPTPSPAPSASAAPAPSAHAAVPDELAARLSAALETALAENGAPGVQAAVVFEDGSTWSGATGSSDPDHPMTPDLLMDLASVTKPYTAALVLRLAESGLLSLDDPLHRWVPDAANADGVTIRQLLTHTSGIASDDAALPPVCAPGACYSYSNAGYGDLGQVVEAATGETFASALRSHFLDPLGLASTFYPRQENVTGAPAIGHQGDRSVSALEAATQPDGPGWLGASGGLVGTAEDAARFFHALFDGDALGDASHDMLIDDAVTRGLPGTTECNAQAMLGRRGGPFGESWSHGGNAGAFRAWAEHYPAQGLTVAVLVNSSQLPLPIADALVSEALHGTEVPATSGRCEDAIAIRAADGTERRLPDEPGFDGQPAWSPDGESIAWLTNRGDQIDILLSSADGSGLRQLTDDVAREVRASWSPDGGRIAYSSDIDGDHELFVLDLADGSTTKLTDNDVDDWLPAWSPDGGSIAFIRTGDGQRLHVIGADGQGDRFVDGADDGAWWPAWSPDGARIAYELGGAIYLVPVAGGAQEPLALPQLRVVRLPAWAPSPDLAFSSDGDLYAAAPDGTNLRRLTATPTEELTPAWAPDAATLAYQVEFWVEGEP